MSVVITEEYNVMVNSDQLICTTENLTLQARCRINRRRYNRVAPHFIHTLLHDIFQIFVARTCTKGKVVLFRNQAPSHTGTRGNGGTYPCILTLKTRCVSGHLHAPSPVPARHPFNTRLRGPLASAEERTAVPHLSSPWPSHYTDRAIAAPGLLHK
jgi:hypothetical protein